MGGGRGGAGAGWETGCMLMGGCWGAGRQRPSLILFAERFPPDSLEALLKLSQVLGF